MALAAGTIVVTGGAGFIGSAVVRLLTRESAYRIVNVDKLTYAGNLDSLTDLPPDAAYAFERVDICDGAGVRAILERYEPAAIVHLAAESHVDRSIDGAVPFIHTNVVGTFTLLEEARRYWLSLDASARQRFRFLHVSTDEVYGALGEEGYFTEETPYDPHSPYAASKAASDHLARAWFDTYGLPVMVTNCSNNYGPFQFPEKLVPVVILSALAGRPIPVYGRGENVRDWLYVDDHARALWLALERGQPGRTYNVGGRSERRNIDVVRTICGILDEVQPRADGRSYAEQIEFVQDRPGHDWRYAIDSSRIERELGWERRQTFESGLRSTVRWYLDNQAWTERVLSGSYRLERLGIDRGRVNA